ncbi:hypothetical protein ACSSS7_003289 [Eimeria intestinalis]
MPRASQKPAGAAGVPRSSWSARPPEPSACAPTVGESTSTSGPRATASPQRRPPRIVQWQALFLRPRHVPGVLPNRDWRRGSPEDQLRHPRLPATVSPSPFRFCLQPNHLPTHGRHAARGHEMGFRLRLHRRHYRVQRHLGRPPRPPPPTPHRPSRGQPPAAPREVLFRAESARYLGHVVSRRGVPGVPIEGQVHPGHASSRERQSSPEVPRQMPILPQVYPSLLYHSAPLFQAAGHRKLKPPGAPSASSLVLLQPYEDGARVVAYASRALCDHEKKWTAGELEAAAVIWALETFKHYVDTVKVCIRDAPLEYIRNNSSQCCRLEDWALRLQEFRLKVQHRSCTQRKHVDCLSRAPLCPR